MKTKTPPKAKRPPRRGTQLLLGAQFQKLGQREFGGSLLKGNPQTARPLSFKKAAHLVMRSSKARGKLSFLEAARAKKIKACLYSVAELKDVKIYRFANSGNHLHLIVKAKHRSGYTAFVRAVSGIIARITLNAERGKASTVAKFWDARPYTRVVEWGREFKVVCKYVGRNVLDAVGFDGLLFNTDYAGGFL